MSEKNPDGSAKLPMPVPGDDSRVRLRVGHDTLCGKCKFGRLQVVSERESPIQEFARLNTLTILTGGEEGEGWKAAREPAENPQGSPILIRTVSFCGHPGISGGTSAAFARIMVPVLQCGFFERPAGGSMQGEGL